MAKSAISVQCISRCRRWHLLRRRLIENYVSAKADHKVIDIRFKAADIVLAIALWHRLRDESAAIRDSRHRRKGKFKDAKAIMIAPLLLAAINDLRDALPCFAHVPLAYLHHLKSDERLAC